MWTITFTDNYGKVTVLIKVLLQLKPREQVNDTDPKTDPR